ncbi:MAG: exodeoxyribonuclease large subunit, partial [Devosia sp.]|nr:exodeoxyribonuclease large subunit [Devosia sp.]
VGLLAAIGPKLSPNALKAELRHSQSQLAPLAARLLAGFGASLAQRRSALDQAGKLLASVGYESVLARGFAIVTDGQGQLVRTKQGLEAGDPLTIRFAHDETVPVLVTGAHVAPKKKPRTTTDNDPQESLF